jgi:hypothetical protein
MLSSLSTISVCLPASVQCSSRTMFRSTPRSLAPRYVEINGSLRFRPCSSTPRNAELWFSSQYMVLRQSMYALRSSHYFSPQSRRHIHNRTSPKGKEDDNSRAERSKVIPCMPALYNPRSKICPLTQTRAPPASAQRPDINNSLDTTSPLRRAKRQP